MSIKVNKLEEEEEDYLDDKEVLEIQIIIEVHSLTWLRKRNTTAMILISRSQFMCFY